MLAERHFLHPAYRRTDHSFRYLGRLPPVLNLFFFFSPHTTALVTFFWNFPSAPPYCGGAMLTAQVGFEYGGHQGCVRGPGAQESQRPALATAALHIAVGNLCTSPTSSVQFLIFVQRRVFDLDRRTQTSFFSLTLSPCAGR